jgi:lantibiotic biosynthesis protein
VGVRSPARNEPLLRGAQAAAARAALADLSTRFLRQRSSAATATLSGGLAGIALAHAALDRVFPRAGHAEHAEIALASSIERIGRDTLGPSLYEGFVGVAWVADRLTGTGELEDGCSPIDEALAEYLDHTPWEDPYDLMAGLVGIGVYALDRLPRSGAARILDAIVGHLFDTAIASPPRGAESPRRTKSQRHLAWRSRLDWTPEAARGRHIEWNLGLAHGVPGVIALLGRVCASSCSFRTRRRARSLLDGAVGWFLSQELPRDSPSCFGTGVPRGAPARSAWCYGDPGVAASLMVAARAVGQPSWQREAVRIGLRAAARPDDTAGVVGAGLCHGAVGLAHIFNRLYRASAKEAFATAARRWFARALAMRKARGGFAGFVVPPPAGDRARAHSDPSLLVGAAGVALALVAAVTGEPSELDRILLLP